jgi:hypothetical protein
MRPLISGIIGAVLTFALLRLLGRLSPVQPKAHPLEWYAARYQWIEWTALVAFIGGMASGLFLYQSGRIPTNDPRGLAVGFAAGCLGAAGAVLTICGFSRSHQWNEYWDFQELKYGAKNKLGLWIVGPLFCLSLYGAFDLLVRSVS